MNAEAVLFVDDRHREIAERNALLEERVGSHRDARRPVGEARQRGLARLALVAPGEDRGADAGLRQQRRQHGMMLARENLGGREQRALRSRFHRHEKAHQRHQGLAAADVALQQAQHPPLRGEIGDDLGDGVGLRPRRRERQRRERRRAQATVAAERAARAAPRMAAHQPERQLAGQQFVMREPSARRRSRVEIGSCVGDMSPAAPPRASPASSRGRGCRAMSTSGRSGARASAPSTAFARGRAVTPEARG